MEGGPGAAREVEQFMWNDHFVIPVISTGGAASGQFGVPYKIFECPPGVDQSDWNTLSEKEATPTELAKAVYNIVLALKKTIANQEIQRNALRKLESKQRTVSNKFRTKLQRRSQKKKTEKLDVAAAAAAAVSSLGFIEGSPDKFLPIIETDYMENKKLSSWSKMKTFIRFTKKTS